MKKGQGSTETLLIIAAVLVIAVAVVLTANYLLGAPTESTSVVDDKFAASLKGAELIGYNKPFDGTPATAPNGIVINRKHTYGVKVVGRDELANMGNLEYLTSLNGDNGTYPVYVSTGGGGGGTAYIPTTPNEADSDGDGITDGNEKPGCVNNPDPNCGVPPGYADLSVDSLSVAASYDSSIKFDTIPLGATVELRATISNKGVEDAGSFTVNFFGSPVFTTGPVPNPTTAFATMPVTGLAALPGVCPANIDYVCGTNNVTYENACYASQAGATIAYKGECSSQGSLFLNTDYLGSVTVSGLAAGESVVVSIPFTASKTGDYRLIASADISNKVPETELENNIGYSDHSIAEVLPDAYLKTDGITISPDEIHGGQTASITATAYNKGGAINGMPVEFFVKDYVPVGINPPHIINTALVTMPITGFATAGGSCPANIDYVCGTDDKTYSNACYASQAGATIAYKGECNAGWHYIGYDTIDVGAVSTTDATLDWTSVEGNYTVIVWANPMGTIDESSTSNNQAESAPFEVQAPYSISPPPGHNTIIN